MKTMFEWHPRLTRSLPLLGSVVEWFWADNNDFATTLFSALTQPLRGRLCVVVTNDGANHGADIKTST